MLFHKLTRMTVKRFYQYFMSTSIHRVIYIVQIVEILSIDNGKFRNYFKENCSISN